MIETLTREGHHLTRIEPQDLLTLNRRATRAWLLELTLTAYSVFSFKNYISLPGSMRTVPPFTSC